MFKTLLSLIFFFFLIVFLKIFSSITFRENAKFRPYFIKIKIPLSLNFNLIHLEEILNSNFILLKSY